MKRLVWLSVLLLTLTACRPVVNQSEYLPLSEIPGGRQGPFVSNITDKINKVSLKLREQVEKKSSHGTVLPTQQSVYIRR